MNHPSPDTIRNVWIVSLVVFVVVLIVVAVLLTLILRTAQDRKSVV